MSYRLRLEEPVPDALRAVAAQQLEAALRSLTDGLREDPVTAVHDARKSLKKTRSLLRLARPGMPAGAYREENWALRDIARSLSSARDADALIEVVDDIAGRYVGRLPEAVFAALREQLVGSASSSTEGGADAVIEAAIADLRSALDRTTTWPLDGCDRDTLGAGITRAYRRGRTALRAIEAEPSVEALHEWRKRVKDLWYHYRLLRNAWPGPLKALAGECSLLSDLLGDDHDLALLAEHVSDAELLDLVAARRAELQTDAAALGRRLYAEKPDAFRTRIDVLLQAQRPEHVD
ncbi:MAG: CHAD domain-containing protein [Solirubrobacteraceae bacterium]